MGKKNKKLKKEVSIGQKRFRLGLKIYAGVLALAILVVCIIVWNKLSKYQDSYDKAKAAGNPDIYAEEFVSSLSYETILEYVKKYGLNVKGEFDYESEHAEYFTELIEKNEATFVRSEKFKSALPVYDIMSGDTRVAVISLKSLGKNDDFGFHKWQLKDLAFDTEIIKYNDVKIVVPGGAKVTYDGNELTAENMVESNVKKDPVKDYALSLGASDYVTESYVVKNNIGTARRGWEGRGATAVPSRSFCHWRQHGAAPLCPQHSLGWAHWPETGERPGGSRLEEKNKTCMSYASDASSKTAF